MPLDDAICCCLSAAPPKSGHKSGKGLMYEKFHAFSNQWDVRMCDAPCKEPACCCIGCLPCVWCCTQYTMRKRVLNAQQPGSGLANYMCGQGYLPKCCCGLWNPGKCGCCGCYESSCPRLCLCCEATCCPGLVITGSRLLAMDMYQIQPDPCDNRLIRLNNCLQCLAIICHILAYIDSTFTECARIVDCVADAVFFSTAGCMVAQLNRELHIRKQGITGGSPDAPDIAEKEHDAALKGAPSANTIAERY